MLKYNSFKSIAATANIEMSDVFKLQIVQTKLIKTLGMISQLLNFID